MISKRLKGKRQQKSPEGREGLLRCRSDERGVALIMVMVISAIALAIMGALMYMLITGTRLSGGMKRYKTAIEAGVGGADVVYEMLKARGDPGITDISLAMGGCASAKIVNATSNWGGCDSSLTIDITDPATYDMRFDLGNYRVYAKIVDTVRGNTGGGGDDLVKTGVVTADTDLQSKEVPYLYSIELEARGTNTDERARLSVLYQY